MHRNPSPPSNEQGESAKPPDAIGDSVYTHQTLFEILSLLLSETSVEATDSQHDRALDDDAEKRALNLWDMSADASVAKHLVALPQFLELIDQLIRQSPKSRLVEIVFGTLGNMVVDATVADRLLRPDEPLFDTCVQYRSIHSHVLTQQFRLLHGLVASTSWQDIHTMAVILHCRPHLIDVMTNCLNVDTLLACVDCVRTMCTAQNSLRSSLLVDCSGDKCILTSLHEAFQELAKANQLQSIIHLIFDFSTDKESASHFVTHGAQLYFDVVHLQHQNELDNESQQAINDIKYSFSDSFN